MDVSVEPVNSEAILDFKWSFKPILVFLKLSGMDLESCEYGHAHWRKILSHLGRITGFLFTVWPLIWFLFESDLSLTWSVIIDFGAMAFFITGVSYGMLIVWPKERNKMWQLIKLIEIQFEYGNHIFRMFRKLSIAVVVLVIFWMISMTFFLATLINTNTNYIDLIFNIWIVINYARIEIVSLSFIAFGFLAVTSFRQINLEIESTLREDDKNGMNNHRLLEAGLKKWKMNYVLLCSYVIHLNCTFNFSLLIEICYVFITFPTNSSIILTGPGKMPIIFYSIIVKSVIILFLLCYIADELKNAAKNIAFSLAKIESSSFNLQFKADSLRNQTLQLMPQIQAYGLFEIGQHLLPTLVGTTLTYLIVMYQLDNQQNND